MDGTIPWPLAFASPSLSLTSLFSLSSFIHEEPSSFTEASKYLVWHTNMASEIDALLHNRTWQLVPPSYSYNLLGSKWVLKIKRNVDGSLKRRKARLVTQGYHQQPELDYNKTFSPTVKPSIICLLISLAISLNWTLH